MAYLRDQGVDDVDVMVASHADSNHIGGLIDVLEMDDIPVQQVIYNGYPGDTSTPKFTLGGLAKDFPGRAWCNTRFLGFWSEVDSQGFERTQSRLCCSLARRAR